MRRYLPTASFQAFVPDFMKPESDAVVHGSLQFHRTQDTYFIN